jgi:CRP/FNR family transcriptional regulator, cyclic AMP receptor protein
MWPPGTFLGNLESASRETMAALLRLGDPRKYDPGEVLLLEGERSRHVVLLLSGFVKVTAGTPEGDNVLLAIRGRGDMLGDMAAIDMEPRSATVTASYDVQGRHIERRELLAFLEEYPVAHHVLTRTVSVRLRVANRRRMEFSGYPVRVRLARVLIELADSYGQDSSVGRVIDVGLTQRELATLVGAKTESVQVALRRLRQRGIVFTDYRRLTVLRPNDLAGEARIN